MFIINYTYNCFLLTIYIITAFNYGHQCLQGYASATCIHSQPESVWFPIPNNHHPTICASGRSFDSIGCSWNQRRHKPDVINNNFMIKIVLNFTFRLWSTQAFFRCERLKIRSRWHFLSFIKLIINANNIWWTFLQTITHILYLHHRLPYCCERHNHDDVLEMDDCNRLHRNDLDDIRSQTECWDKRFRGATDKGTGRLPVNDIRTTVKLWCIIITRRFRELCIYLLFIYLIIFRLTIFFDNLTWKMVCI